MDAPIITKPFFVEMDEGFGYVKGGFFGDAGGMLVGDNAQWVCDALNDASRETGADFELLKTLETAFRRHATGQETLTPEQIDDYCARERTLWKPPARKGG